MNRHRTIALLLILVLVLASFSAVTIKATGPLFKVTFRDNNTSRSHLETIGATIVEDYGSYVLANIDPSYAPLLTEKGYDLVLCSDYNTVAINGTKLHPDENKNLIPETAIPERLTFLDTNTPEGYYIIQFIGPIKEGWKNDITATGAAILGYYNTNAMLIRIDSSSIYSVVQHAKVQGATPYFPAFKIDANIKYNNEGKALISILLHQDKTARSIVSKIPGEIVRMAGEDSNSVVVSVAMDKILQIALLKDVAYISNYVEPEPTMDFSREILGVQKRTQNSSTPLDPASRGLWDEGLKGEGEIVTVQDSGLDTGDLATLNIDFEGNSRLVQHFGYDTPYGPDPFNSKPWSDTPSTGYHGTFCLSQIAGSGANSGGQFAGIAPKSRYIVERGYGWLNPGLQDSYKYGSRIHSNSWGVPANFGTYGSDAQYLDSFVYSQTDQVVTMSAGNEGFWGQRPRTPGTAKNCITIGAAGNNKPWRAINSVVGNTLNTGATQPTNPPGIANFAFNDWVCITGATPAQTEFRRLSGVTATTLTFTGAPLTFPHPAGSRVFKNSALQVTGFSSRGPTSDNRLKPDVVGPGVNIAGVQGFSPTYKYASGTSMSNPNVAGVVALTRQWLKQMKGNAVPSASLVKALLINGARNTQYQEAPTWTTLNYPDTTQGWGYVDGYTTLYPTAPTTRKFWDYKRGISNGQRIDFPIVAGPGKFKVSLVWSDPAAVPNANPALINDLDLVVNSPDNTYFYRGNAYSIGTSESMQNPATGATTSLGTVPDTLNNVEGVTLNNSPYSGLYTVSIFGSNIPQGPQPFALVVQYEATLPDFEIIANPNSHTADTNITRTAFPFTVKSLNNFLGTVALSIRGLPSEFQSQFQNDYVNLSSGISELNFVELIRKFNLKIGKYYITIRGESGNLWHEEEVELIIRPGQNYKFNFGKGVNLDNISSFGDDGMTANPGQKLYYSLSYDSYERDNFSQLYVDDKIPTSTSYTNLAFPNPTHYSLDDGQTWTNAIPPTNIGSSCTLRWALHEIDGNGRMQKVSTGTPGFENLSNNSGTSFNSIHKFDSNGNIHVVWADNTTGYQNIYYKKWNGTAWVDLAGNPGFSYISNIYSTSDASSPDMAIDSNGHPHFVWLDTYWDTILSRYIYSIWYIRWNGTSLVNAAGVPTYDIINSPNSLFVLASPKLALYNNSATVVFSCQQSGYRNIYITRWNGTAWAQMDGITPGIQIAAAMGGDFPNQLAIGLETNGNPIIVSTVYTLWWIWSYPYGICATKWNGTAWTQMNGITPGYAYIAPTWLGPNRSNPNIAMQGDIPHIVWSDASISGNNDIYYTKWVNGGWFRADGITGGIELISTSNLSDLYPNIALDSIGNPGIVWCLRSNNIINTTYNVVYRQYRGGWSGLLGGTQLEKITDSLSNSLYPFLSYNNTNIPYFSFTSDSPGNYEVFITYPNMNYTNINFPGQIIWGTKIDQNIPSGVSAITNTATIFGIVDTLAYYVKTGISSDQTVNPLSKGIVATISANPSTVAIGNEIKFTVTVSNTGKAIVDGINATFIMPNGLVFVRARPTAIANQGKINWQVGSLGVGQSVTYLVYCKVTNPSYQEKTMSTKLIVTANGLPTIEKYSTIYVSKSGGGFPTADFSFKLSGTASSGQEAEFILTIWSGNGPYSYKIEWGDNSANESGNAEENVQKMIKHTFASSGEYTVTVSITDRYGVTSVKHIKVKVK